MTAKGLEASFQKYTRIIKEYHLNKLYVLCILYINILNVI